MDPLSNNGKLFGIPVRIATAADLIAMKKRAALAAEEQRVRHEAEIELLKNDA